MVDKRFKYTDQVDANQQIECEEYIAEMIFHRIRDIEPGDNLEELAQYLAQQALREAIYHFRPEYMIEE